MMTNTRSNSSKYVPAKIKVREKKRGGLSPYGRATGVYFWNIWKRTYIFEIFFLNIKKKKPRHAVMRSYAPSPPSICDLWKLSKKKRRKSSIAPKLLDNQAGTNYSFRYADMLLIGTRTYGTLCVPYHIFYFLAVCRRINLGMINLERLNLTFVHNSTGYPRHTTHIYLTKKLIHRSKFETKSNYYSCWQR